MTPSFAIFAGVPLAEDVGHPGTGGPQNVFLKGPAGHESDRSADKNYHARISFWEDGAERAKQDS